MIQFPTQSSAGVVPGVRAAGFPLATTSDFALALADLAGVPGRLAPPGGSLVPGLPVRPVVADIGKDLPVGVGIVDADAVTAAGAVAPTAIATRDGVDKLPAGAVGAVPADVPLGAPPTTASYTPPIVNHTAPPAVRPTRRATPEELMKPVLTVDIPVTPSSTQAIEAALVPVAAPLASPEKRTFQRRDANAAPPSAAIPITEVFDGAKRDVEPVSETSEDSAETSDIKHAVVATAIADPFTLLASLSPPTVHAAAAEIPVDVQLATVQAARSISVAAPVPTQHVLAPDAISDPAATLDRTTQPDAVRPDAAPKPAPLAHAAVIPIAAPLVALAPAVHAVSSPSVEQAGQVDISRRASPAVADARASLVPSATAVPKENFRVATPPAVSRLDRNTLFTAVTPDAVAVPGVATVERFAQVAATPAEARDHTVSAAAAGTIQPSVAPTARPSPTTVAAPVVTASAAPVAPAADDVVPMAPAPVTVTVVALSATPPPALPVQPAAQVFAAAMFGAAEPIDRRRKDWADDLPFGLISTSVSAAVPAPVTAVQAIAPSQQPTLDTTRADWMASMIDQIETLRDDSGGVRETRMKLAPEALGSVEISVRRDDAGAIQVRIAADSPHARAFLAEAAPRLAEMAEARGVKLAGSNVDAGGGFADPGRRDTPAASAPIQRRAPADAADDLHDTITDTRLA